VKSPLVRVQQFCAASPISEETEILSAISDVVSKAPFRYMITPGGFRMSVAMTNCGALGWVTDRTG
jgi:alkylated DNA repair protein (DNA oxidative demethylase)